MSDARIERVDVTGSERAVGPVRLGLIALSTDLTSERDAARLFDPAAVALHTTRVPFENPTTPENLARMAPRLAEAADLLVPGLPLAAISFGCTAASVVIGDRRVAEAIRRNRPGVPVVTPASAACGGLRALGARRIALLTPYLPETTAPMIAYLEEAGFDVVRATCMGIADDRDIAHVSGETILSAAEAADTSRADALFISCTALPAMSQVPEIERRLGKPVVTSNQAAFWAMMLAAGLRPPPILGRLASFSEARAVPA